MGQFGSGVSLVTANVETYKKRREDVASLMLHTALGLATDGM